MKDIKLAACQEMFVNKSWDWQFSFLKQQGYEGVEIAPFTFEKNVLDISALERDALRAKADEYGINIIGLHWLLAKTEGFYLNTPDEETRQRTADYLCELARLCADLGGNILVLGSPLQRKLLPGVSHQEGDDYACKTLDAVLKVLEETRTYLCLEPLGRKETNFWNTCQSVVDVIKRLGSPWVRLHQDVKAMSDEEVPIAELIHQFKDYTHHFHVNDVNLLGPGMGDTPYGPILKALHETGYQGWLSLEVFDYSPGSEHIAKISRDYLLKTWERVINDDAFTSYFE